MNNVSIVLGMSNVAVALISIAVSIPLLRGRIKPNVWYGFRFSESFESEDAWFAINRYGAARMILWSIPLLLLGLAAGVLSLADDTISVFVIAGAPLLILVPCVESWRFARHYRADV